MTLSIKHPELEQLARQLAAEDHTTVTQTILDALRAKQAIKNQDQQKEISRKLEAVKKIQEEVRKHPDYEKFKEEMKNLKTIRDAMWE